ncbi:hypothetical protein D3C76_1425460 [compost metagenome]
MGAHQVQNDELRLGAMAAEDLFGHLQQRLIPGVFICLEITAFQELHFVSPFSNAGDGGIVFTNLPLVREPPALEARAVGEGHKVILILRLVVHHPVERQPERLLR